MTYDIGEYLKGNAYPGRGVLLGLTPGGEHAVLAYFIMGRSANSRNRVFAEHGDGLRILPFDASKVEDPSLIIYDPVRVKGDITIVGNGDHTDTVFDFISRGESFEDALRTRCFEPDAPNWTPRISGLLQRRNGEFFYKMSMLKSAEGKGISCLRAFYEYEAKPGRANLITTYMCDGSPLPSYEGEPAAINTRNDIGEFTDELWSALNADNRISLYVRYIDRKSGAFESRLINKNL